ncbi:response regulator transcription factor [Streptomyces sp. NBC_00878]|uniref:response regulator transcription factor n=1 Tax=Streptomyces sp. NBC_00878 TaxID=2975854 RepID=UPI00225B4C0C|nr:response regulator transcription factor [Streptomyces sp. NBC_00878]MCX4904613.1 response regulator transcription factor [Streptomyces sp. NBC_00878]
MDGVGGVYETGAEASVPARGDGQHVLVIVHDSAIAELLTTTLDLAGYRVTAVRSGAQGMARLAEHRFDLVVLDVSVPDIDDLGEGRRFRPADRPPVLFLAAYQRLGLLVSELGLGESDYVTMPFRISEVLARAHVLLRGRTPVRQGPRYGDLVLNDATCQAWRGRRALDLTPAEYRLLRHLLVNSERVLSKEQICRHVWGETRAGNAIEKLVSRLRRKVDQEQPPLIHTRRGFGYRLGR